MDCKFTNANFDGCDLSLVSFVNGDFANATLNYITFGTMIACNLKGSSLVEFYVTENTVLIKCDFTGAVIGLSISDQEIRIIACVFKNIQSISEGKPPFVLYFENKNIKFLPNADGTYDLDLNEAYSESKLIYQMQI